MKRSDIKKAEPSNEFEAPKVSKGAVPFKGIQGDD
jgi:hypothetical protein